MEQLTSSMIRFEVYIPVDADPDTLLERVAELCDGATVLDGVGLWDGVHEGVEIIVALCKPQVAPILREVIAEHFACSGEIVGLYCEAEVTATILEV